MTRITFACAYCRARWKEHSSLLVSTGAMPKCPVCGQRAVVGLVGQGDPALGIRKLLQQGTHPANIAVLEREILRLASRKIPLDRLKAVLEVAKPGGPRPYDFEEALKSLCDKGMLERVTKKGRPEQIRRRKQ
jgi:hypothetical protein